jgi:hypothetical protein
MLCQREQPADDGADKVIMMGDSNEFSIPDLSQLGIDPAPLSSAEAGAGTGGKAGSVLQVHHNRLMRLPGVVMVGEGQDEIGDPAILVGVKTSADLSRIPPTIEGMRVVAEVIGEVDALPAGQAAGRRC